MIKKAATVTVWAQVKSEAGINTASVKALVTNVGSGHFLPTGIPGIRQMWLEVVVKNAQGAEVLSQKAPLEVELIGPDGKPAMPWSAVRIGRDTRIAPRKSREMVLEFAIPAKDSRLEVRGSVYYRRVSELAARTAGIKESPPVEIAGDQIRVFSDGRVERVLANE